MFKTLALALVAVTAIGAGIGFSSNDSASAAGGNGKSNCSASGSPNNSFHLLDNVGELLSWNAQNQGFGKDNNPGNSHNDEWPVFAPNWDASGFFDIEGPFPNCNPNSLPFTP